MGLKWHQGTSGKAARLLNLKSDTRHTLAQSKSALLHLFDIIKEIIVALQEG